MTLPICQWKLSIIFTLIASVLPGCQSARTLFPTAQKDEPGFLGPYLRPAQERESTIEARRPQEPPANASLADVDSPTATAATFQDDESQFLSIDRSSHLQANSLVNSLEDASMDSVSMDSVSMVGTEVMEAIQAVDTPVAGGASGNVQLVPPAERQDQAVPVETRFPRLIVSGVRPGQGDVRIAIFKNGDTFPHPNNASQLLTVKSERTTLEIPLPIEPPFAIALYQDINSDGELTRNRVGIPVEPFAFSNNAMGKRGPPSFADSKIESKHSDVIPLIVPIQLP